MRTNVLLLCVGLLSACLLAGCPAESPETPSPAPSTQPSPTPDAAQTPVAPTTQPAPATSTPTPAPNAVHDAAAPLAPAAATAPKTPTAPAPTKNANDALADKAAGFDPNNPDRRCKIDSDCAVKDVGNCCGRFPMCVNKNAKTDPAAVAAQCAKQGMASICGFEEITACQCVDGQCKNAGNGAAAVM